MSLTGQSMRVRRRNCDRPWISGWNPPPTRASATTMTVGTAIHISARKRNNDNFELHFPPSDPHTCPVYGLLTSPYGSPYGSDLIKGPCLLGAYGFTAPAPWKAPC